MLGTRTFSDALMMDRGLRILRVDRNRSFPPSYQCGHGHRMHLHLHFHTSNIHLPHSTLSTLSRFGYRSPGLKPVTYARLSNQFRYPQYFRSLMALQLLYHDWKTSSGQRDSPDQLPEGKRYPHLDVKSQRSHRRSATWYHRQCHCSRVGVVKTQEWQCAPRTAQHTEQGHHCSQSSLNFPINISVFNIYGRVGHARSHSPVL